jgi:hypothetical protein
MRRTAYVKMPFEGRPELYHLIYHGSEDISLANHSFKHRKDYSENIPSPFPPLSSCKFSLLLSKETQADHPHLFSICFGSGTLIYANYIYNSYIIGAFHKYPEPVAKQLRKALYYTNISLEPQNALKYYKEALRVADEIGMDPFSDEILGVKIQLASFMEKIQQYQKAIDVLEIVRRDCLKWIDELGNLPENVGKRTKVLGKTVGISVKLSELYANEYVMEKEAAEEKLVWAVTTLLKEQRRREVEGEKPEEGPWLSPEEIGGSLEGKYLFF